MRIVSAVLLLCFVIIGGLSIGPFYTPSAALMLIAAVRNRADWASVLFSRTVTSSRVREAHKVLE